MAGTTVNPDLLKDIGLDPEEIKRLSEAPVTAELYDSLAQKWTMAVIFLGADEGVASKKENGLKLKKW